jgi:hypothetical protein
MPTRGGACCAAAAAKPDSRRARCRRISPTAADDMRVAAAEFAGTDARALHHMPEPGGSLLTTLTAGR